MEGFDATERGRDLVMESDCRGRAIPQNSNDVMRCCDGEAATHFVDRKPIDRFRATSLAEPETVEAAGDAPVIANVSVSSLDTTKTCGRRHGLLLQVVA